MTTNSAIFSRKSKIIWKPDLHLNIGMSDFDNFTMHPADQNSFEFTRIAMEEYILHGVLLIILLLLLLFMYVCFWKWVAQGNLDLPKFGGGSQLVFNCFPNRSGLKKSESTQVLPDTQENEVVDEPLDEAKQYEDNDSTDVIDIQCDND